MKLKSKVKAVALLAAALLGATPLAGQKLYPRDDAARDPSFFTFRAQLLQAVQRRDTAALYAVLAPDIKSSFGGHDGMAGFKRLWRPEGPDTRVWEVLNRVLSLGGRLERNAFRAPYIFADWPSARDAFEHLAVVGGNVSVRAQPDAGARRVAVSSYDIVRFRAWKGLGEQGTVGAGSWAQVELKNGQVGWINGLYVYSPVYYRAFFEKRNGRWLMTIFLAGD